MIAAIEIKSLRDVPEFLTDVAFWHHSEWQRVRRSVGEQESEEESLARLREREALLKTHLSEGVIPNTFLAVKNGQPIGSVSLVHYQFSNTQKPSEWLTNLYVCPQSRRQGVGDKLLSHAVSYASENRVGKLMLYTAEQTRFYCKRNWRMINKGVVQGQNVDILDYRLS